MSSKTFAKRVSWTCIFGFAATGIAAAWTDDERFGLTAFVLLVTGLISAVAAAWNH